MAGLSISNLSLFSTSSSSSGNWMSSLLSNTSDYASIRNGSYSKLMKAYYSNDASSTVKKLASQSTDKTTDKEIAAAKSDADDLKESTEALMATGTKSLFNKKEIETTDEETGEKVKKVDYDRKAINSAVKSFVESYNNMIDSGSDVDNTRILQKTLSMTKVTNSNKNLLSSVGISVKNGNKLSIDEEKLAEADISALKSLFNGSGSYASQVAAKASDISSTAVNASLNSSLYGSGGSYYSNSYSSLFDYGI